MSAIYNSVANFIKEGARGQQLVCEAYTRNLMPHDASFNNQAKASTLNEKKPHTPGNAPARSPRPATARLSEKI